MISTTYGTVTGDVTEGLKGGHLKGAHVQPETGPLSRPPCLCSRAPFLGPLAYSVEPSLGQRSLRPRSRFSSGIRNETVFS